MERGRLVKLRPGSGPRSVLEGTLGCGRRLSRVKIGAEPTRCRACEADASAIPRPLRCRQQEGPKAYALGAFSQLTVGFQSANMPWGLSWPTQTCNSKKGGSP